MVFFCCSAGEWTVERICTYCRRRFTFNTNKLCFLQRLNNSYHRMIEVLDKMTPFRVVLYITLKYLCLQLFASFSFVTEISGGRLRSILTF